MNLKKLDEILEALKTLNKSSVDEQIEDRIYKQQSGQNSFTPKRTKSTFSIDKIKFSAPKVSTPTLPNGPRIGNKNTNSD